MEGRHSSNYQSTSTLAENIFGAAFLVVSKYLPVTQLLATCLPSSSELKYLRLLLKLSAMLQLKFNLEPEKEQMVSLDEDFEQLLQSREHLLN